MASIVQICNLALGSIGAGKIASITDASEEARRCNEVYEILRDEVLEAFPWSFARARATLARDAAAPAFGYAYQYILPSDMLRPLSIYEGDTSDVPYVIEGRLLLTDSEAVSLRYIKRESDPTLFSPAFVSCLAARLAVPLAMSIAKSTSLSLKMFQIYGQTLKAYQLTDAKRDEQNEVDDNPYGDARGGY